MPYAYKVAREQQKRSIAYAGFAFIAVAATLALSVVAAVTGEPIVMSVAAAVAAAAVGFGLKEMVLHRPPEKEHDERRSGEDRRLATH